MTRKEFSDAFATLINSYARQANFGEQSSVADIVLDEYEKSVFLTKAQEEVVISLYNGTNKLGKGFEETEELRRYLDPLIETVELESEPKPSFIKVKGENSFYKLPKDLMFITMEQVETTDTSNCKYRKYLNVVPTTQDSYSRIKNNPFKGPTKYRVLRLDYGNGFIELVPPDNIEISKYLVRYLRKPKPILLDDFSNENLEIGMDYPDYVYNPNSEACELNPILHSTILERAVYLALQSKGLSLVKDK